MRRGNSSLAKFKECELQYQNDMFLFQFHHLLALGHWVASFFTEPQFLYLENAEK